MGRPRWGGTTTAKIAKNTTSTGGVWWYFTSKFFTSRSKNEWFLPFAHWKRFKSCRMSKKERKYTRYFDNYPKRCIWRQKIKIFVAKNEKLHHRNFKISQKHHPPRWYFQVHQLSVHRGAVSLKWVTWDKLLCTSWDILFLSIYFTAAADEKKYLFL